MLMRVAPVVPLIVVALSTGDARAQDRALQEKVVRMNGEALADVDKREWDGAKKKFLDVLAFENLSGLDKHPLMARTYVYLGVVYILGFEDRHQAVRCFRHALEIQPDIRLSRRIAITSEVNDAFVEAGGRPERPSLDCPVAPQTRVDEAVPVRCAVAPGLPVTKVFLLYREPRSRRFTEVEMKGAEGRFEGRIPERAIYGESLHVYFEGRNAAGKPIVNDGDPQSPKQIIVVKR